MEYLLLTSTILFSTFALLTGLFFFFNPAQAIEIQRKFNEKINWKIEPISLQREIRNTKILGIFTVIVSLMIFIGLAKVL